MKSLAAERGVSLKKIVTDAVQLALGRQDDKSTRMEKPPVSLAGREKIPFRSNEEIAAILETEDLLKVR